MEEDDLYLYSLTLQPPLHASSCVVGQFSGNKKVQELVLLCGLFLEVYRPAADTGKLDKVASQKAFAIVQSIDKIRLVGTQKDLLVVTSDSGKLVVAEFQDSTARFMPIVQEPHLKNGLRRITPGEYLCVNPTNRAVLVGALERTKLVYKVEMENTKGVLELSSPLEVSSKSTLTLAMCALDTSQDNPLWAAIEVDYSEYSEEEYDPQTAPLKLNYYELDQGLNHVVQRRSKPDLPSSATALVPLPGHIGGVIVCCDSYLIYEAGPGRQRKYLQLPVRKNSSGTTIVNFCLQPLKKTDFLLLLQSTLGDLFKVTVDYDSGNECVNTISLTYFDSIPPCNGISVFKSGFLFANISNNNKLFYQFESLGEENESTLVSKNDMEDAEPQYFTPQGLQNMALVDILDSLSPLTDSLLLAKADLAHIDPLQLLVTLSSHSYLKTLTHGLPTSELVSSPLPMLPTTIFTTKMLSNSPNDQYLVLSSSLDLKTLVLSIGEVVEEVADSSFVLNQATLAVQQVGKHSLVQVYTHGIRHIKHTVDAEGEITGKVETDWYPPAGITVLQASANNEQVVVGLSNREVCYFEIDPTDDQLTEYQERFEVAGGVITALAIMTSFVSKNDRKSPFAIVGTSDETIQVLSLLPHNCFDVLTLQALSSSCHSLLLLPMDKDSTYVHIGMTNGVYARVHVDSISGNLSDTRLKYLGTKPVQLRGIALPGLKQLAVLAISSRPWAGYFKFDGSFKVAPLLNTSITSGTSFFSEDIGLESIVGINRETLSILTVGSGESGELNQSADFTSSLIKLRYTPRKLVKADVTGLKGSWFFVLESEAAIKSPYKGDEPVDADYYNAFGYERDPLLCGSCIEVVNYDESEVVQSIEFENNESAIAVCQASISGNSFVVVATAENQSFSPPYGTGFWLYAYKIVTKQGSLSLDLTHKTKIDGPASALASFEGKVAVAIGNQLRLYELGMKQMLRKSSTRIEYLRRVNQMKQVANDVLMVGDANESISILTFDSQKNHFLPLSNDIMKRQVTAFATLDNRTVVGGDRFGNIFLNRIPQPIFEQLDDNILIRFQEEFLGAASTRFSKVCDFFIQDIPTSFQKGSFVVGGTESIIYTGLRGTVGLLLPLATKQEVKLLLKLEMLLRKHFDDNFDEFDKNKDGYNLVGREHGKYVSYYNPVKNVVDGDFVERFYELTQAQKIKIAGELKRAPREVERKLYDLRNRAAF